VPPPMWRGGPAALVSAPIPEGMTYSPQGQSANELINPDDMIVPVGGGMERLGAAYRIRTNLPYNEPANWQPTRASEFYGWGTGR
jgi:hypothetical protein